MGETMLSNDDNALLAQTGPGTAMGELFRRFWLPAALSSEIMSDGPPLRLRLLGEDLLAFRDSDGRIGIVEPYCSHKLAPLFFGRNEECGLRCVYHGWKFDVDGRCVDIPNVDESAAKKMKPQVGITSYPTREVGGMIWVNLGPKYDEAVVPELEWTSLPAGHVHLSRWLQRSNYAQGLEGEIDSSHLTFLHRGLKIPVSGLTPGFLAVQQDGAPVLEGCETDYGIFYGARRTYGEDQFYWRTTHWLLPFYSLISGTNMLHGRAWVPVDDHHVMTFNYLYRLDRPFTQDEIDSIEEGGFFPPLRDRVAYAMPDGTIIDTYVPRANRENDYEISRDIQRTETFTGIRGANDQDRCLQENMRSAFGHGPGRLVDRSREHLVASDRAGIMTRRMLLRLARELQNGIEPRAPYDAALYRVRAVAVLSEIADFETLRETHKGETHAVV
jgi:phenylpropionate dioxygenase-like ring-hydroxylating dioxygenase large terminal subunit